MTPSVVTYALNRLADLGIGHVFGVPGDYAFPINDAVEVHPRLTWVPSANELNAAYAADGYARRRGAGIVCMPDEVETRHPISLSLEGEGCADLAACCLVVAG